MAGWGEGDVNAVQGFDGGFGLAPRGPKGGEIMLPQQGLRRLLHGVRLQWQKDPANAFGLNAGAHGRLQQHIGIAAGRCMGAAVKAGVAVGAVGHFAGPVHGNVTG